MKVLTPDFKILRPTSNIKQTSEFEIFVSHADMAARQPGL